MAEDKKKPRFKVSEFKLSEKHQKVLHEYCEWAGNIWKIFDINGHLKKQVDENYVRYRGSKPYMPQGPIKKAYDKILFAGRKRVTSIDSWPSEFRFALEECLCLRWWQESENKNPTPGPHSQEERENKFSLTEVFVFSPSFDLVISHQNDWKQENWKVKGKEAEDLQVLRRYQKELVEFQEKVTNHVEKVLGEKVAKELTKPLKKETRRYVKCCQGV